MQNTYSTASNTNDPSIILSGLIAWAFIGLVVALIVQAKMRKNREISNIIHKPVSNIRRDTTEALVEWSIAESLYKDGYIIFGNLIIPSVSNKIRSTQIDHVIISVHGIFCIETKSHSGYIYGRTGNSNWRQYLGPKNYSMNNPIQQNNHHVKSLEYLLRANLKGPIHSYLVFPNASKIMLDGNQENFSIHEVIRRIKNHTRQVYSLSDVETFAKALAYVSDHSESFESDHIEAVKKYVNARGAVR